MKLGTQIKLGDGREGTVVYNSLIGVGIKWGLHTPDPEDFSGTDGNTFQKGIPPGFAWEPDALLRDPSYSERFDMECVGEDFEILRHGLGEKR